MNRVDKYEHILKAASEVFLVNGFEKSTVQEIAVKAGIGKGTIYEYFSSKEELFGQVLKTSVSYVYDDLIAAFDKVETIDECAETFLLTAKY